MLAYWFLSVFLSVFAGQRAPAPARPAVVRGRVAVPDAAMTPDRPGVTDLVASSHAPIDRRRVVVYLDAASWAAWPPPPPGRARMDQRDQQFVPHVLPITTGTIVDFPNDDRTFHDVFSLSRVRTFDLGRYPPGHTASVRFDRPGVVPVFCDIHSHMSAYILVFNHPFFSLSDDNGRYEIDGVPPGTYTIAVWSELGSVPPRQVTVADGAVVDADFEVRSGS